MVPNHIPWSWHLNPSAGGDEPLISLFLHSLLSLYNNGVVWSKDPRVFVGTGTVKMMPRWSVSHRSKREEKKSSKEQGLGTNLTAEPGH